MWPRDQSSGPNSKFLCCKQSHEQPQAVGQELDAPSSTNPFSALVLQETVNEDRAHIRQPKLMI